MSKTPIFSPQVRQRIVYAILWLSLIMGLILLQPVILPFLLSLFIAYILNPMVTFISKKKFFGKNVSRGASVLVIYSLLVFFGVIAVMVFAPKIYDEITKIGKLTATWASHVDENTIKDISVKIETFISQRNLPIKIVDSEKNPFFKSGLIKDGVIYIDVFNTLNSLFREVLYYIKDEAKTIVFNVQKFLATVFSSAFKILLVLMVSAFVLADTDKIKQFFFQLVPGKDQKAFDDFLFRVDKRLSGVVRGQIIICFVNAVLTLVGLLVLQVHFAFILALLAGVFSIVPIFGSIISTIPIVLVALTNSFLVGFLSLCWIILIHALEANLLNPKILGNSAKIHPVLIILALVAGQHYYGIVGALLAVPIISIAITIYLFFLWKLKEN